MTHRFLTMVTRRGARIWPSHVPTSPADPEAPANRAAWEILARFDKPFLCCFSDQDPVTAGGDGIFRRKVPVQPIRRTPRSRTRGHFLQEDAGPQLAQVLNDFIAP